MYKNYKLDLKQGEYYDGGIYWCVSHGVGGGVEAKRLSGGISLTVLGPSHPHRPVLCTFSGIHKNVVHINI